MQIELSDQDVTDLAELARVALLNMHDPKYQTIEELDIRRRIEVLYGLLGVLEHTAPASPSRTMGDMTFSEFQEMSWRRSLATFERKEKPWDDARWLGAITGELGELAGTLKERWRQQAGWPNKGLTVQEINSMAETEVADLVTYCFLFASSEGFDLGEAVMEKFEAVSHRFGYRGDGTTR